MVVNSPDYDDDRITKGATKSRKISSSQMKDYNEPDISKENGFLRRHPILANVVVIFLIAFLGIWIAYLSLNLFTNHGATDKVPSVEKMSYTQAIEILHDNGFRVDIRDSIYNEEYKPGYVIEQFPKAGSIVKPGRKVFLYINAVHPREVVIDMDNNPSEYALKGYSYRQGMARLEELGFKNISIKWVTGESDRIIKLTVKGRPIKKLEKVPVTAPIIMEVSDGKLSPWEDDSIFFEQYQAQYVEFGEDEC